MDLNKYNSRLIDAARESSDDFVHYFLGWMLATNHVAASRCAEKWMEVNHPDKLERFKRDNKKDRYDRDEEEVQEN